jgi:hypothetical protein
MTPYAIPQWESAATDHMHLERRPIALEGSQNLPSLEGADVDLQDYTEAIVTGFCRIYRLLMESRAHLLGSSGLITVKKAVSYCGLCGAEKSSGGKTERTPISKPLRPRLAFEFPGTELRSPQSEETGLDRSSAVKASSAIVAT